MMNTRESDADSVGKREAFPLVTLIVTIVVIFAVAGLLTMLVRPRMFIHTPASNQLNDGRQVYLALRNYAADHNRHGEFPAYQDPQSREGPFANSNEALEVLLSDYIDKRSFFSRESAWCRATQEGAATANLLQAGENDWVYVRGLNEGSPSAWPLLANAFAPGTIRYVSDPNKPGGVYKGTQAVFITVGGNAEIVDTKRQGDTFYIPRPDAPTKNAFERDGEWLAGDNVQVLYPKPPTATK